MAESSAFRLSRIYAQGWSVGRKYDVEDVTQIDALGDDLNPHLSSGERKRWQLGFTEAARRKRTMVRKSHLRT